MALNTRTRRNLAYATLMLALLASVFTWRHHVFPAATESTDPQALPIPGQRLQGKVTVFDADTLALQGRRLRLEGIDAPEFEQTCGPEDRKWPCGKAAIDALKARIDGRELDCSITGIDRYRRGLARCSVGGTDLNRWLVRNGWAVHFGDDYLLDEIAAEKDRAGLWRDDFVRPSQWRRTHPRPE